MSEEENKLIRAEFRRMLDKLIDSKIRPTATEIISVEQPLISLFEEVMYKLENQQKEIERQQEEIDTWEETENDYEHELARKDEEVIEVSKRLIIEEIKRFSELYKPKEGIGEQGLDEIADEVLSFSKNYIRKDKIKEIFQFYIERDSLFNDNPHKMAVIRLKDVLEELLEENK